MNNTVMSLFQALPLPVQTKEKLLYFGKSGYWVDLDEPKCFNEKILWRKLKSKNPMFTPCTDKVAVRDYVREKIGEEYLIPLLYSGPSLEPEQLLTFGDKVVVKANHDCGSSVLIHENTPEKAEQACAKLRKALATDYGATRNEWWYRDIKPQAMVEKMIVGPDGGPACDFKFIMVKNADGNQHTILFVVYDRGTPDECCCYYNDRGEVLYWNGTPVCISRFTHRVVPFPCPEHLDDMLAVARKLSEDFDHVRVDLYLTSEGIKFGELTFSLGAGRNIWSPQEYDEHLGALWAIEDPAWNPATASLANS